jgi:hypothetical protein
MGEIGRSACISGFIAREARSDQPAHRPSGMPINAASVKPHAMR